MNADFEARFYDYMYSCGHISAEANLSHLREYLGYFSPGALVLDVGCGQGDFMELLRARGCQPRGVDSDPRMVKACNARGLSVHLGDALEYLRGSAGTFDGIFLSNVIEHFPASQAVGLFALAFRALKPGGTFLVAVPNPESLIVHLYEFWRDATHARLYNRLLLEFMLVYSGFQLAASGTNPATGWSPPLARFNLQDLSVPDGNLAGEPPITSNPALGADGVSGIDGHVVALPGSEPHGSVRTPAESQQSDSSSTGIRVSIRNVFVRIVANPVGRMLGLDAVRDAIALVSVRVDRVEEREQRLMEAVLRLEKRERRLAAHVQSLEAQESHLVEVTQSLREATLFLYPPRETFVVGRRPDGTAT
ncbi:MAG: class I SAM-dependent methyltransferase [Chloroflexi bacterium]|nr:class I SAM-dependent methyltransferase [Chloroflexota bacterium]